MKRFWTILSGIVLALAICQSAWAQRRIEYGKPCPGACVPNVGGFGYYQTQWRQWPGEQPLAIVNPRAVNAEVLPTPQGREHVPPPAAGIPKPPSPMPEGDILPRSQDYTPSPAENKMELPELPAEPKAEEPAEPKAEPQAESEPAKETELPGLPVEPDTSILPTPFDNNPAPGSSSDLNLPSTEKPKEGAKPDASQKPSDEKKTPPSTKRDFPDRSMAAMAPVKQAVVRGSASISLSVDNARSPFSTYEADWIGSETTSGGIEPAAYASVEAAGQAEAADAATQVPTVALSGYCPVELVRGGRWVPGSLQFTVVYEGRIYRLAGPSQRKEFLDNPEAFAPAFSGNDPVLAVDQSRMVPGRESFCATYAGRLYMFSSAETQSRFSANPRYYAAQANPLP